MRYVAQLVAVAVVATGCAGGAETPVGEAEFRSPIAEFFGYDADQDPDEAQAEWEAQQVQVEALVVDCMAAQGFQYDPVDQSSMMVFEDEFVDLTPLERAQEIGYGITQYVDEEPTAMATEFQDPNQQRIEAMDPAEQEAYYAALYGDYPEPTFDEDGEEIYDETFIPTGCQNEAYESTGPGDQVVYRELSEEFNDLYEDVEADARVAAATTAWSTCLAEAGFTYASMEEIFTHLDGRMNEEVYRTDVQYDEEGNPDGPTYDEAALADVRAEEIDIAVADTTCQEDTDLHAIRQEVQIEYEEAFIAEHQAVFDAAAADQEG